MRWMSLGTIGLLTGVLSWNAAAAQQEATPSMPEPRAPQAALESFQVEAGLQVILAASEPLVADPVAIDWDDQGRLWVVEMGDYPLGGEGVPGGGRVKVLSDRDGDWAYDEAVTFLDGLNFPTGIKTWRGGALITAAPDILWAQDQDGDGRADHVEKLYQGFGEGNQQHRVNGMRWGLDGWLYVANGDSGGRVAFTPLGAEQRQTLNIGGRDVRIRPDSRLLETVSGATQFGRTRDDWGNWFGGNNSNPLWHYPLREEVIVRNRFAAPPSSRIDVPEQPGAAPVYPISRTLPRFNDLDRVNRFTSACGPAIYRDDWLGPEYRGDAFICEPVHNLVRREVLRRAGVSFSGRQAVSAREFLASNDNWFRPVMVRTGPDGALWVVDMYRLVIEHPEWIPRAWQDRLDLRSGEDRGRVYRIVADQPVRDERPLSQLSIEETAAELAHPNGTRRDLAHQRLAWELFTAKDGRTPPARAVAAIRGMLPHDEPLARLHALCLLGASQQLELGELSRLLQDEQAGVRRWAARWADAKLATLEPSDFSADEAVALGQSLLAALHDQDPQVVMESAAALGRLNASGAQALAELLTSTDDPYIASYALSALHAGNAGEVARRVLTAPRASSRWMQPLLRTLSGLGGDDMLQVLFEQGLADAARLIDAATPPDAAQGAVNWPALTALLQALGPQQAETLGRTETLRRQFDMLLQAALIRLRSDQCDQPQRLAILEWFAAVSATPDEALQTVAAHMHPRFSAEVQEAAVAAIARWDRPLAADLLLQGWAQASPALRQSMQTALLSRTTWARQALSAAERGEVSDSLWSARTRQLALNHRDDQTRALAAKLWRTQRQDSRQQLAIAARACLSLPSDLARGQRVFEKRCASCHQLHGRGHALGPDIAALSDRSPHALLTAILAPNAAVEDKYQDYAVALQDGRRLSGLLLEENANAIVLGAADGKRETVLRTEIELVQATGKSLMPEGLERDVPQQELADLIAFLRSIGPPPKSFEGNQPSSPTEPVIARDGVLTLAAAAARIHGPNLMFEPKHANLGFWRTEQDYAEWSLIVPRAGKFRVVLEYACDRRSGGSELQLIVAGRSLQWKVEAFEDWDVYRRVDLGVLDLPGGPADARLTAREPIPGFVADIKAIELK